MLYINNSGLIAGGSDSAKHPGVLHCAPWDKNLKIHNLGTLKGGTACGFGDIDDQGRATGVVTLPSGAYRAILWSQNTGLLDLNNLIPKNSGWVLATSGAINLKGLVAQAGGPGSRPFFGR